jgi:zinc transporter
MNSPVLSYGSDASGVICAYRFDPRGGVASLDSGTAEAWLAGHTGRSGADFLWLHVNLSHSSCEKWLKRHAGLSSLFHETLHEGTRSTRIEYVDDSLIAVINDVLFDFAYDASDISTLYLHVGPRLVVSARGKPLRSVDRLRAAVKRGLVLESPVDLLVHLLRDQADVLTQIVRDIADKVDGVEDRLLANRPERNRASLGAWRRLLVRLQRLMAPEPAALFRLLNRPPVWVPERDLLDLRQSTEEFSTVLQETASLQERIKLLQEEIASQINEQTNRSLFVLTVVSVLVLPINIISGLFGMNVGGIPLAGAGDGFWEVVALVATFTLVAAWFAFRERE